MMHEWSYGWGHFGPVGMLIFAAVLIWPFWRICTKAGYPGIASLLVLIPIINVIFLYWLAFSDWPSLRTPPPPAATT